MKKIDVVKIERVDENTLTCELMTIEDKLEVFYKLIGCRTIDIVERRFGGVMFDVVCDDEALLRDVVGLPTSLWFGRKEKGEREGVLEGLYGTLLLCHHDDRGELTSATCEDLLILNGVYIMVGTESEEAIFHCLRHDL